jgi:hypothetical protein
MAATSLPVLQQFIPCCLLLLLLLLCFVQAS